MNFRDKISNKFGKVVDKLSSDDGRLAYLSLTSKPEGLIRDEFAWLLQKDLKEDDNNNLISTREYSRYDLAVLETSSDSDPNPKEPNSIKYIFEFKACVAGDFKEGLKAADGFITSITKDFKKAFKAEEQLSKDQVTSLLIAVEAIPKEDSNDEWKIADNQRPFVKYAARHNSLLRTLNDIDGNEENYVKKHLKQKIKQTDKLEYLNYFYEETNEFNHIKGLKAGIHLLMIGATNKNKCENFTE